MLILIIILASVLVAVFFFVLLVLFIIRLLAKKSGITELGVRYPRLDPSPAESRRLYLVVMNGITFKGSLSVGISSDGLYLTTNRFFQRLGRVKPALIPWGEIKVVDENKLVNNRDAVGLTIGDPPTGNITFLRKDYTEMQPFIKDSESSTIRNFI